MAAVQTMCARIGMVTGRGLMSALRRNSEAAAARGVRRSFIANTINSGPIFREWPTPPNC